MKTLSEDRIAAVESAEVIFESAAFLAFFFFLNYASFFLHFYHFIKCTKLPHSHTHTYVCFLFFLGLTCAIKLSLASSSDADVLNTWHLVVYVFIKQ